MSFTVLSVPNSVFHYFLDSILMVPLNFNNKSISNYLICFSLSIFFFLFFSRSTVHLHFSPKYILVNSISGKYSFKKFFFFNYNCIIIRLEHVDMLSFLHYNTELISVIWSMRWTLASWTLLHFTFALKKGFHRNLDFIWFNKIFLSNFVFFCGKLIV